MTIKHLMMRRNVRLTGRSFLKEVHGGKEIVGSQKRASALLDGGVTAEVVRG